MKPEVHIHQYNVNGDNIVSVDRSDRVQVDLLGWAIVAGGVVVAGAAIYGLALGAIAAATAAAPYLLGAAAAGGAGIGGVKVWQKVTADRQKLTPPPLILSPRALEIAARFRLQGHELNDSDLAAIQRLTDKLECSQSLPYPSASSALPALPSVQSSSQSQAIYDLHPKA